MTAYRRHGVAAVHRYHAFILSFGNMVSPLPLGRGGDEEVNRLWRLLNRGQEEASKLDLARLVSQGRPHDIEEDTRIEEKYGVWTADDHIHHIGNQRHAGCLPASSYSPR